MVSNSLFSDNLPTSFPVKGYYRITLAYGNQKEPFTGKKFFHDSIDIAAYRGAVILASGDGVVEEIGVNTKYLGNYILINHNNGFKTRYDHLEDVLVIKNQEVNKKEVIGTMGSSGRSTGPHLGYSVVNNTIPINPEFLWSIKFNNDINIIFDNIAELEGSQNLYSDYIIENDDIFIFKDSNIIDVEEILSNNVDPNKMGIIVHKNKIGDITSIELQNDLYMTNRNIQIGSSILEVLQNYGKSYFIKSVENRSNDFLLRSAGFNYIKDDCKITSMSYIIKEAITVDDYELRLNFIFENSRVQQIHYYKYVN